MQSLVNVRNDLRLALIGAIRDMIAHNPVNQVSHICDWLEAYATAKEKLDLRMKDVALNYRLEDGAVRKATELKQCAVKSAERLQFICQSIMVLSDSLLDFIHLCENISRIVPQADTVYVARYIAAEDVFEYISSNRAELIGKKLTRGNGVTWRLFSEEPSTVSSQLYISNVVLDPEVYYHLTFPKVGSLYMNKFTRLSEKYVFGINTLRGPTIGIPEEIRNAFARLFAYEPVMHVDEEVHAEDTVAHRQDIHKEEPAVPAHEEVHSEESAEHAHEEVHIEETAEHAHEEVHTGETAEHAQTDTQAEATAGPTEGVGNAAVAVPSKEDTMPSPDIV